MNLIDIAKERVGDVLQNGETAVDATLGNGWDLLFLAERVGSKGLVYGFDVQAQAIESSRKRLVAQGWESRAQLHLRGHEEMAEVICEPISAVMFNLGYLPYAEKEIITRPRTTLLALDASLRLLKDGGILSIMCYRGHAGGLDEASQFLAWRSKHEEQGIWEGPQEQPEGTGPFLLTLIKSS